MKNILSILAGASILIIGCNKDKSKVCTYHNKPLNVEVRFAGYFDYEITNFDVYQFQKNTNFSNLLKVDEVRNDQMAVVKNDTSSTLFYLNNKADYMLVLHQLGDTFKIENINYKEEYFDVIEPSGVCDQQREYSQRADTAYVNNTITTLKAEDLTSTILYLSKP